MKHTVFLLCLVMRLSAILRADATAYHSDGEIFPQAIVLDYARLQEGDPYSIRSPLCENYVHYVYGTGDVNSEKFLDNVVIRDDKGTLIATLATLALKLTNTTTGLKTPLELPGTHNYTIKDDNEDALKASPYYIYITRVTTAITVFDANYPGIPFNACNVGVVMSMCPLMTLRRFDLGIAENATFDLAVPNDPTGPTPFVTLKQESANMSIAKIFGPIVTITPNRPNTTFSFSVDTKEGYSASFHPGAQLIYSSAGAYHYSHPLRGKIVDVTFSLDSGAVDIDWDVFNDSIDPPNITFTHSKGADDQPSVQTGLSQVSSKDVSSINVHRGVNDQGGFLVVSFNTGTSESTALIGWMAELLVVISLIVAM